MSDAENMADDWGEYRVRIQEMPEHERPRERLERYGEGSLSTPELLAIALRTGSSARTRWALLSDCCPHLAA